MTDSTATLEESEENKTEIVENHGWGRRLINTLIAPDRSFEVIRDHKSWLWALTALLIIVAVAFPQTIIIQRTIAQQSSFIPEAPPGVEFSDEDLAAMQQGPPAIFAWSGLIGSVVGLLAIWLVWAGVILLFVSMFGGRTEFGRLWRLAVWAWLPAAVQGIISGIYLLIAGGMAPLLTSAAGFMQNPYGGIGLGSSPQDFATFVPPSGGEIAMFSLAGWLDPFIIWRLLLLVLGVMIIAKINWKKSAAIILIPWLLGVGIAVGLSAGLGGLGGGF